MRSGHFPRNSVLFLKKICCKVSSCENFQRSSCKAFTGLSNHYLTVQEWLVGDVPLYVKFWVKLTHCLQKAATSNRYSLVKPSGGARGHPDEVKPQP